MSRATLLPGVPSAGRIARANAIIAAIKAATDAGHPLIGQVEVAVAAGLVGSDHSLRRQVSSVVALCAELVPVYFKGMVWNRDNDNVYRIGEPTMLQLLEATGADLRTVATKMRKVKSMSTGLTDPDAGKIEALATGVLGHVMSYDSMMTELVGKHTV